MAATFVWAKTNKYDNNGIKTEVHYQINYKARGTRHIAFAQSLKDVQWYLDNYRDVTYWHL